MLNASDAECGKHKMKVTVCWQCKHKNEENKTQRYRFKIQFFPKYVIDFHSTGINAFNRDARPFN